LGGIRPARSGSLLRNGKPVRIRRPRDAVRAGIVVIPEDRKREGLILEHTVRGNVGLASLEEVSRGGIVRVADERRLAEETVRRFGVRPPRTELLARSLSGGNQQKVAVGKWPGRKPGPRGGGPHEAPRRVAGRRQLASHPPHTQSARVG